MAKNTKLQTYSLDVVSLKRLDELQNMLHLQNRSGILCLLINKEYRRQLELREESED